MLGHEATEVEEADVAWLAVEHCHHHGKEESESLDNQNRDELEALKSDNRLHQILKLLENLSESPALLNDCPPDLYARLVATVDSEEFLTRLKSLHQTLVNGTGNEFAFKDATADDVRSAGIFNDDEEEPRWVWVTDETVPSNVEELSGIDKENYVVVSEEDVVDAVASFMAKCVMSNPKAADLAPEELKKVLAKALGGVNKLEKLFYTLLTLAGLYRGCAVLRLAATGVRMTSKVALRSLNDNEFSLTNSCETSSIVWKLINTLLNTING